MTNAEIRARLIAVARKLESVEVRGSDNMQSLLTCINYLAGMANDLAEEGGKDAKAEP